MDARRWFLKTSLLALATLALACSDDATSNAGDTGGDQGGDTGDQGGDTGDINLPEGCDALAEATGDDYTAIQELLIGTAADSVICFAEGTYSFDEELSLNTRGITIRGLGDGVMFDFTEQEGAANGLLVTGDDFTIENVTIQNSPGDGIRVEGAENVIFRDLTVTWDGEPREENGAYAIYPVGCNNVLVENSTVFGASDAGIYVGQSTNIVVRHNTVHGNVAGIEIENSTGAEVYDNEAFDNTGGILVFNLENLPVKNGERTRIFANNVHDNNRANFAPEGNIVASVPAGVGIMVLANDKVEIHDNTITDNDSTALLIVSTFVLNALGGGGAADPDNDDYPESIWIHDNTFSGNGTDPQDAAADLIPGDDPLEDIVWDGAVDGNKPNEDGALDLCIDEAETVTFLNFDLLGGFENMSTDRTPHDCAHESLAPLDIFPEE